VEAYDRLPTSGKKILPIVLPSMVEAEKFSDDPCIYIQVCLCIYVYLKIGLHRV